MADPLAIYGAIATSIDLLTKIYQAVRRYLDLPDAMVTAKSRMLSAIQAFENWQARFKIESGQRPGLFYQAVWGPSGYKQVVEIWTRLKMTSDQVSGQIDSLIVNIMGYDRRQGYGRHFQNHLQNQVEQSHRSHFTWKRLVGALVDRAGKVDEGIASFNTDLIALQRVSYSRIYKMYGVDMERGGSFDKLFTTGLLHRRARIHAESLHDAFLVTRPTTYLALEALEMSPQESARVLNLQSSRNRNRSKARDLDKQKDFQFLLQKDARTIPVWLRPVTYTGRPDFCKSFKEIIEEVEREGSCNLMTPGPAKQKTFRVREYDESYLKSFHTVLPLRQHLRFMWPRNKAQVAYAIACGFYRVVGSPWGNYFECANIHAKPITTNEWTVALHAQAGDPRLAETLAKSQMIHHKPGQNLEYHCQVYRLGVILAEIALERPADYPGLSLIKYSPLLMTDMRGPRDAAQVAFDVVSIMGHWYGNAVYFCLSLFEKPDEINQEELDRDFEQEVLIP